jgi:cellulose synthase/poly-beta-1,6-N-acetylglucosamine synthase-like glycosyltransferase
MNCFNIRELQGILKRRFFVDLVNSHDHKNILSTAMIGAKHRLHNNENINLDIIMFYNWGVFRSQNHKVVNFNGGGEFLTRLYVSAFNFTIIEFFNLFTTLNSFFNILILSLYSFSYLFNFLNFFTTFFSVLYSTL